MLELNYCHTRQGRLQRVCEAAGLDAICVGLPQHVYYFSGHWPFWLHHPTWVMLADGRSCLISANSPAKNVAAGEVRAYPANAMGTQRQEQPLESARGAWGFLTDHGARRIGVDASLPSSQLTLLMPGACQSVDEALWQLRRQKYPDELALMRQAIACTVAMYDEARRVITPGISEIEVFAALNAAAVREAGEPLTALLGNDYACGVPGGPARKPRVAKAGDIYILDLGPCYRGYFADNCRAFCVGGNVTAAQQAAWEQVTGVFPMIERLARPGARCRDIYDAVDQYYVATGGRKLPHHLGHGVGLQPHEFPHLNPHWDDVLLENEVFTVEPGIYGPELAGGIRIENNYRVTATGVEALLDYPMTLT